MSGSMTTTNVSDNRSVADANAQSATAGSNVAKDTALVFSPVFENRVSGKNISVNPNINLTATLTDYGAIDNALKFAGDASANAKQSIKDVLGVAEGNFDKTTAALQDAYKDAKGGALVLQQVTVGMMLTIAALGYFWMRARNKK